MDKLREFEGENFLGAVELAAFPLVHLVDLLERQERQHTDALEHVRVAHIAPVLVELERRRLIGVEPDSALRGLAHLLALGVHKQRDGHCMRVLAELAANQLRAAEHIRPLVVAAELHVAAVMLEQVVKIIRLHDHVVELEERQALFHALLVALGAQHVVDREACANVAQQLDIVELQQPVRVIDHDGLALAEVDEAFHLLFEAVAVVLDDLRRHHRAHVRPAGGVSDIACAAANEDDGAISRHLEPLHEAKCHEMADVQRVRRGVKANVECGLAVIDHFANFRLVGHLRDEPARLQFFIDTHCVSPSIIK